MKTVEDLEIYRRSYQAALKIQKLSISFPSNIQFSLGDQIKRSSRSIPVNIAEGFGRRESQKDFARFITLAIGSAEETKVHLSFLCDLECISKEDYAFLRKEYDEILKMLSAFRKSLRSDLRF